MKKHLKKLQKKLSFSSRNSQRTSSPKSVAVLEDLEEPTEIVIVGAGIVGLVLALALNKQLGIKAEVYEQAQVFHDDVGAGMGMYPNGLRVIRDIDPELLQKIKAAGHPYGVRRWERHDGTEVAVAEERVLAGDDEDLMSIGIRRWRLQKVLFEAVEKAGIKIHFRKRLESIKQIDDHVNLKFEDGTDTSCKLLLASDGSSSRVRKIITNDASTLKYTGTQCLMGTSSLPREEQGLCLPSSPTSKCHGAFYPVAESEQCFQFHFPVPEEEAKASQGSWGALTEHVGHEECKTLANRLIEDGWDRKYLEPLYHMDKAIKIGFSTLDPPLETFVQGQVALVGDAAHPPVPYLGQGAQQGLEDAGTLALLLKHLCLVKNANGNHAIVMSKLQSALKLYDEMRVPRTQDMLTRSEAWGKHQQKRAENENFNRTKEKLIQRDVFFHETMPVLLPGVQHDYKEEVLKALPSLLPVAEEEK
eukprot:CAMPEP_0113642134 /NCGR_PEP_ID=MMETSP0017_2-20120614/22134_1 /TAXON_ID=2856 /ORGANISM="Cylindrotheca closterium" /LENGTH=473 /DNA_ID=CAMNT_0000553541 /DNA_START=150 /DNA_END=1571 /DNA_ORIENTATION=- /assembly_acc=CAM_ASM_000147